MNEIPVKYIIGLITAIVGFIALKIKLYNAKQSGRDEIISEKLKFDLTSLRNVSKKREVLDAKKEKLKDCVPDDWDAVNKLRKEGLNKFTDARGSGVCQRVPGKDESDKTT